MASPRSFFRREGPEFDRGLGFFDAVYGFAITLLIANVDMPPAEAWQSFGALLDSDLGHELLGFAISFAVIALFWRLNAVTLAGFTGIDGVMIAANLVSAFFIVLIPFTTQGMSEPDITEYPLPTVLYAINIVLLIVSTWMIREVGRVRGLLAEEIPPVVLRASRLDVLAQVGVLLLSIPIAYLVGSSWAQLSWLLLIPVGFATGRWVDRVAKRAEA